eukprot:SM000192S04906  [mRNA]  locus=s192:176693:182820:+ [translate_table: standard]
MPAARLERQGREQARLAAVQALRAQARGEILAALQRRREELGLRAARRAVQAQAQRLARGEQDRRRHAAARERAAKLSQDRALFQSQRAKQLQAALLSKISRANARRLALLAAERERAGASAALARQVAEAVAAEREREQVALIERLEAKLAKARRRRAEILKKRGGCIGTHRLLPARHRCWRQFRASQQTTLALAHAFARCRVQLSLSSGIPFEQLAARITAPATLRAARAFLVRLESRLLSRSSQSLQGVSSNVSGSKDATEAAVDIQPLLRRLAGPKRRAARKGGPALGAGLAGSLGDSVSGSSGTVEGAPLERYPARIFLCSYMVLSQPAVVFNQHGVHEEALTAAAGTLVPAFEELLAAILSACSNGSGSSNAGGSVRREGGALPSSGSPLPLPSSLHLPPPAPTRLSPPPSLPEPPITSASGAGSSDPPLVFGGRLRKPFASYLAAFDAAWVVYLERFVAWKLRDQVQLEEDLISMACQLEASMLAKCQSPATGAGPSPTRSHDLAAIRHQARHRPPPTCGLWAELGAAQQRHVAGDQQLLREKVLRLTGPSGEARMDAALGAVRAAVAQRSPGFELPTPPARSDSPEGGVQRPDPSSQTPPRARRSLFPASSSPAPLPAGPAAATSSVKRVAGSPVSLRTSSENERLVQEMLLSGDAWQLPAKGSAPASAALTGGTAQVLQARVRSTMESAFWDSVLEGLLQVPPDNSRITALVSEVRAELAALSPASWRPALEEALDADLLVQVLATGSLDFTYMRQLLNYSVDYMLRLGAPSRDAETRLAHRKLLEELSAEMESGCQDPCEGEEAVEGKRRRAFIATVVRGLQFLFTQLQVLKQDISKAHLRQLAPLVQGSAGVAYLRQAFAARWGFPLIPSSPTPAVEPQAARLAALLPRTAAFLAYASSYVASAREELEASRLAARQGLTSSAPAVTTAGSSTSTSKGSAGVAPLGTMKTGGSVLPVKRQSTPAPSSTLPSGSQKSRQLDWAAADVKLRLGLLRLVQNPHDHTLLDLPETLELDLDRVRNMQEHFQQVLVLATGSLVLRQGLVARPTSKTGAVEVFDATMARFRELVAAPDVSLAALGELLEGALEEHLTPLASRTLSADTGDQGHSAEACVGSLTRVLAKALQPGDPVFTLVSAAIGRALASLLLLGSASSEGLAVAEHDLRRAGAAALLPDLRQLAECADLLATVNLRVHKPLYEALALNVQQ